MEWRRGSQPARHWQSFGSGSRVECLLCPRHCKPHDGQPGYCRVRGNVGGSLHTFNYGLSVQAAAETIETEAVYHYRPGTRILSLGNVGCMMSCTFCHNWETSQAKHVDGRSVRHYTPEQVVELAMAHGIRMLSWTYNDPVVWHEFVVDTARLAARHGIQSLYKSAFYIEQRPAAELIDVIDVFSLSLKSMSPEFYLKVTGAKLQPVLDRIEQVHAAGRHLEISQLLVTELNDREQDVRKTVDWVLGRLGPGVPLHFVRFHPAYKYTRTGRTPIDTLLRARALALEAGVQHCYLGNVYRPGVSDTICGCGARLVERFGLTVRIVGITREGTCTSCGRPAPVRDPFGAARDDASLEAAPGDDWEFRMDWNDEINSVHVVADETRDAVTLQVMRVPSGDTQLLQVGAGLERIIISKSAPGESGIVVRRSRANGIRFLPVLDRAHFPIFDSAEPGVKELTWNRQALAGTW